MRKMQQQLSEWLEKGLISAHQMEAIVRYEEAKPHVSRMIIGLSIIGTLSIGLGIISMIAAHWEDIPAWVKLGFYFTYLLILTFYAWIRDKKPGLLKESLLFGLNLSVIAGIGLVAQVFHLPSDGWRGFTLWCILCIPIMLRSQSQYVTALWYTSFFCSWLGWISTFSDGFNERLNIFLVFSSLMFIATTFSALHHQAVPRHPFQKFTLLVGTFGLFLIYPWLHFIKEKSQATAASMVIEFALCLLWCLVLSLYFKRNQIIATGFGLLCFLGRIAVIRYFHYDIMGTIGNFAEGILWTGQLAMMGFIALYFEKNVLFDLLTLLIAARIFLIFVLLMGSIFATGIGLIAFGGLILAFLWIWYKYRLRFRNFVKATY